jgi:Na+-driven multidrug efflux pump
MIRKANRVIAFLIGWVVCYYLATNIFHIEWISWIFLGGLFLAGIFLLVAYKKESDQRKQVKQSEKDQ